MSVKLNELMSSRCGNHLLPFLWLHGEPEADIRREINKIHDCGVGSFCVESRPHPDFVGDGWWHDMDICIDEAKKLGMKIWILDDAHFPTGGAAGKGAVCDSKSRKTVLNMRFIDVTGPLCGSSFIPHYDVEELIYTLAVSHETGEALDISDKYADGRLYFDVPEGVWRIYYFYKTEKCMQYSHINHLRQSGAQVLIDAVYEPHYAHYGDEFGKTVSGFFSDEPGLYACEEGYGSYELMLGDPHALLSWDDDMEKLLTERIGLPIAKILPALSDNLENDPNTAFIRHCYMDIVTSLYSRCFCDTIGDWCRAHGVEYMGHIIEDNDSHSRICISAGHFFRGMSGQDFSGSDVVLHQILPGMENIRHAGIAGFCANYLQDGEFYSHGLYNMTASLAQIDPKKRGRAMCELFGAYGWAEGCKMMKWMADFLLVRGINTFVPHAFSPKSFPDTDCPPHFYAHGKNPQYEGFKALMPYMNRVAHLLSNGHHDAEIAVLYHGDFTWSGGEAMPSHKPGRILAEAHLQYDIIPADSLDEASASQGVLKINTQEYKLLIVPYTENIPEEYLKRLSEVAKGDVCVVFINALPAYTLSGADGKCEGISDNADFFTVLSLDELSDFCKSKISQKIVIDASSHLQAYVYNHSDDTVFMLHNPHPSREAKASISVLEAGNVFEYDAYSGKLYSADKELAPALPPYESRIYVVSGADISGALSRPEYTDSYKLDGITWHVSVCTAEEYPNFKHYEDCTVLQSYNRPGKLPDFSGIIRYEAEFDASLGSAVRFSGISETVQVWINDEYCGMCIAPPYTVELGGKLKRGKNKISIETRNTLYNALSVDGCSRYLPIEASGITGDITILY